jgi:D-alanyl-D-alanine carboxypeptidase
MRNKRWQRIAQIVCATSLLIGGVLALGAPHPPRISSEAMSLAEIEAFLSRLVATEAPPSVSVVVVQDGRVVYDRAFGMADGPKQRVATPETVYHWWSMTKIVTAIAIMQLHEQGKLELDDPVTMYLPDIVVRYPTGNQPPITIRQLLNHTSGLPDTVPAMLGWVHYDDTLVDQRQLLRQHLPAFNQLQSMPGTRSSYSNLGYMVLGEVIEVVSKQSYANYIQEHILDPLAMEQTGFLYTPAMQPHEASGSQPIIHPYTPLMPFLLNTTDLIREPAGRMLWFNRAYIDPLPPSGLIGSAPDVARLMLAYLNNGELDGKRILSVQSVQALTQSSHMPLKTAQNTFAASQGLGWLVINEGEQLRLQHDGGGPGFATTMRLYPDQDLGIVILANGTDLDRDGISAQLAHIDWSHYATLHDAVLMPESSVAQSRVE